MKQDSGAYAHVFIPRGAVKVMRARKRPKEVEEAYQDYVDAHKEFAAAEQKMDVAWKRYCELTQQLELDEVSQEVDK